MTSAEGIDLATLIIENDTRKAGPLVKLLVAFKTSRGDPLAEVMMDDVLAILYTKTEHYETALEEFVAEQETISSSVAA